MRRLRFFLWSAALVVSVACGRHHESFLLGTTTSVDNSGLLPYLNRIFQKETGIEIHALAVGSGKALQLAREGKVDVVLSHDPEAERVFVSEGHAALYQPFMKNSFVIVGPPSNPAGILPGDPAVEAFRRIHDSGSPFVSRGDQSGTHTRELKLWKLAGVDPASNSKYVSLGQSMGALLRSASEMRAYTLTDTATFEQLSHSVTLRSFGRPDPLLVNIYAVTLVRRATPTRDSRNGERFVRWLLSEEGRRAIASYPIHGKQMFQLLP